MHIRQGDLSWQELDDEIVVLDLAGSSYLKLNGSGAVLFKRLVDGAQRTDLVDALVGTYDIGAEQAATDVDAFLEQLTAEGLLEGSTD